MYVARGVSEEYKGSARRDEHEGVKKDVYEHAAKSPNPLPPHCHNVPD